VAGECERCPAPGLGCRPHRLQLCRTRLQDSLCRTRLQDTLCRTPCGTACAGHLVQDTSQGCGEPNGPGLQDAPVGSALIVLAIRPSRPAQPVLQNWSLQGGHPRTPDPSCTTRPAQLESAGRAPADTTTRPAQLESAERRTPHPRQRHGSAAQGRGAGGPGYNRRGWRRPRRPTPPAVHTASSGETRGGDRRTRGRRRSAG
jgi:hypothetical protein